MIWCIPRHIDYLLVVLEGIFLMIGDHTVFIPMKLTFDLWVTIIFPTKMLLWYPYGQTTWLYSMQIHTEHLAVTPLSWSRPSSMISITPGSA
jgi:hypothetical protein